MKPSLVLLCGIDDAQERSFFKCVAPTRLMSIHVPGRSTSRPYCILVGSIIVSCVFVGAAGGGARFPSARSGGRKELVSVFAATPLKARGTLSFFGCKLYMIVGCGFANSQLAGIAETGSPTKLWQPEKAGYRSSSSQVRASEVNGGAWSVALLCICCVQFRPTWFSQ